MRVSLFLLAMLVLVSVSTARAQVPAHVRVVDPATPIIRWSPPVPTDVLTTVERGTTLEVLDKDRSWYWVITPRDGHGTRRVGWIAARHVEVVANSATDETDRAVPRAGLVSAAVPSRQANNPPEPATVVVTSGGGSASGGAGTQTARKAYQFDDVYFDLNRSTLKPEAKSILDEVTKALTDDPLLRVTIEGHTCNLGTAAYNLALGERRADAVKVYLLSKGVPGDRVRTISLGEQDPKYDNSREQTRHLNRRAAVVPDVKP